MRRPVEDAEVERQHREHKADEAEPEPDVGVDHHPGKLPPKTA
jgi:hypothetical protein